MKSRRAVVRELFPDGIWLYPDPDGGRYLWAYAQTVTPGPLMDADGHAMVEGFPRVYSAIAVEVTADQKVAGSGSGGPLVALFAEAARRKSIPHVFKDGDAPEF